MSRAGSTMNQDEGGRSRENSWCVLWWCGLKLADEYRGLDGEINTNSYHNRNYSFLFVMPTCTLLNCRSQQKTGCFCWFLSMILACSLSFGSKAIIGHYLLCFYYKLFKYIVYSSGFGDHLGVSCQTLRKLEPQLFISKHRVSIHTFLWLIELYIWKNKIKTFLFLFLLLFF